MTPTEILLIVNLILTGLNSVLMSVNFRSQCCGGGFSITPVEKKTLTPPQPIPIPIPPPPSPLPTIETV
jgi:hypothetical protein